MSASSSSPIRRRSPRARPTWCARWSATTSRSPGRGGNPAGGLGTSFEAITDAIDRAWSEAGVAIFVDLGGAETNSEMAIEMLPDGQARPCRHLQRADRRGRGDRRDRSLGRREPRRCAAHGRGAVAMIAIRQRFALRTAFGASGSARRHNAERIEASHG